MTREKDHSAEDVRAWDDAADVWADFVRSGKDYYADRLHGREMMRMLGDVRGKHVCDFGCGEGRWSRALSDKGAIVTGVDAAPAMIGLARECESKERKGIEFVCSDLRSTPFPAAAFDAVVSAMVLMDVGDLRGALREARRIVKPSGRLVASICHPITNIGNADWLVLEGRKVGRIVRAYFREGRVPLTWSMSRLKRPFTVYVYNRTLSSFFNEFFRAGFAVVKMSEPRPTRRAVRDEPDLEDALSAPASIVLEAIPLAGKGAGRRMGGCD